VSYRVLVTHQAEKELRRLAARTRTALLEGLRRLEDDPSPDGHSIVRISADSKGVLQDALQDLGVKDLPGPAFRRGRCRCVVP